MASLEHKQGFRASAALACLLAGLLAMSPRAAAVEPAGAPGQPIHRCRGAQGEIVFSGLPCGTPLADPADAATTATDADASLATACPTSREELVERLDAALARHDANAIAALLRWDGVGGAAQRMRELNELARRPLLELREEAGGSLVFVRTGSSLDDGIRELAFGIHAGPGCHWLLW